MELSVNGWVSEPDTAKQRSGAKVTAIQAVHYELRQRIMDGELRPNERLHIDNLRKEFNVGTSTVREALSRLVAESLVVSRDQRGFRVSPLSLKDFRDITDTRKVIETSALRSSLAKRDDEWEGRVVAAYHRLTVVENHLLGEGKKEFAEEWSERNAGFHDVLVGNCNNAWLIGFRRTLHRQSYRYQRLALSKKLGHRDVRIEHKRIFEAAMRDNVDECARYTEDHIEATLRTMLENLQTLDFAQSYLSDAMEEG